ncbi:MAG: Nramp family divalent metal transporter [Candidatus Aenigmarchaeota archaeon]|nr:Nramp family divalent metal transporter [Candidatus Aenigmarchaeota archaeon]
MANNLTGKLRFFISILADRKFWVFFGSGFIVSVAYMDPGNWGTSISSGAAFKYDLLWVVWLSSGMAMLFQYLSGKMGIAGYSLAEVVKIRWKSKRLVFFYWILAEIAVLATDLAEFLGIVVALNLLFGIPMLLGSVIAMLDVLLLLFLTRKSFKTLEYGFIIFVFVIGISYVYELFVTHPELSEVLSYSAKFTLTPETALFAVGIIGATVMPHALFIHSWLIKNKLKESRLFRDKKQVLMYHKIDNIASLFVAGLINAAIMVMAAAAFYGSGYEVATIEQAYLTLTPLFGGLASTVFAVALLSAGISSSITGTLSGQAIMESLTDFKLSIWMRRLITRFINLVPLVIAILLKIEPLQILVYSQVVLSLMIPLPLIPLIYYSSDKRLMGRFVNQKKTTILASVFALIILVFNGYLIYQTFFGG